MDYLSERHRGIERKNIDLFINSIRKYHIESTIIHCTDIFTETFKDVDIVHREKLDLNYLMFGRVKCFSSFPINSYQESFKRLCVFRLFFNFA